MNIYSGKFFQTMVTYYSNVDQQVNSLMEILLLNLHNKTAAYFILPFLRFITYNRLTVIIRSLTPIILSLDNSYQIYENHSKSHTTKSHTSTAKQ